MRHSISNANLEEKSGDCSVCGPNVKLLVKSKPQKGKSTIQRYCSNAVNAARKKRGRATAYGITHDQLQLMLAEQDGLCKICRVNPATHIDHCHSTLEVRGVLCNNCNTGLGMFGDNQDHLKNAIDYLTGSQRV